MTSEDPPLEGSNREINLEEGKTKTTLNRELVGAAAK